MKLSFFVLLVLTFALAGPVPRAFADQVTLKNGDRLTGIISVLDGGSIIIKTEYAGPVTVKWDAVQDVTSDQPLYVTTKDGQTLLGKICTSEGKFAVTSSEAGTVTVGRDAVTAVRSRSEQNAIGAWAGFLDAGLSLSRGNSDTTNLAIGANATRTTARDKTTVFVTSIFAKNKTNGLSQTTASAINGGLRYDFNLSARTFAFAFANFDHDRFQDLDLRSVLGGGLGYHALKRERGYLDLFGGTSLNQEFYSTRANRRSAEGLAAEEAGYKLNAGTTLKERLEFYPNLTDTGNYRVVFDSSAATKLSRFLTWQTNFSDRYLSNPVRALKGNNLLLSTGLRVTFGPQR